MADSTSAVPRKLRSGNVNVRVRAMSMTEVGVGGRGLLLRLLAGNRNLSLLDHLEERGVGEVEVRGHFLAERRLIEQLGQRRRVGAAVRAGALDEDAHDHLRVFARRVRREPGVVAAHERKSGGAEPAALGDDLHRAGLAGDVEAVDARVAAGAAFLVDDFPQPGVDVLHRLARDVLVPQRLHRHLQALHAAVGVRVLDHAQDVWPVDRAAVRDGRHHHRDLQRRDDERSLADADGDRLRRVPLAVLLLRRPFGRGDEAGFFAVEVDLRDRAEAEGLGVLRDLVDAETRRGVVEKDVARDLERVFDGDGAVPLLAPAAEAAPEEDRAAAAVERGAGADRAFRETRRRHHGLEDGAGGVEALDGAIELDLERVRDDGFPDLGREALRVDVRIERRRRDHRQHFAVARVEHDRGADEFVFREVLLGAALEIEVDRQIDVVAGDRILARRAVLGETAAVAVVLPVLRAVLAAEELVVHQLDAALAEEIALLEVLAHAEVFLRGLADEAEDVREERAVRIVAALHRLDVELGKGDGLRLDHRHLRHAQILGDDERTRERYGLRLLEARLDVLRRRAEGLREEGDELRPVRGVGLDDRPQHDAVERQRIRGLIVGDDLLPGAVEDQPALRRRDDLAQRVGLGESAVFLRLHALDEPERAGEEDENDDDRPQQGVDAEGEELLVVSIYAHGYQPAGRRVASIGSSRRNSVSN